MVNLANDIASLFILSMVSLSLKIVDKVVIHIQNDNTISDIVKNGIINTIKLMSCIVSIMIVLLITKEV